MRAPSHANATLPILREEHAAMAAVLRSLAMMIERGPDEQPGRFFDVQRAMLFYIASFPSACTIPRNPITCSPSWRGWHRNCCR